MQSSSESALRLGFAVKVVGRKGLKSHDTRRWQNSPHLRVSLEYLREIMAYLAKQDIHMYRMSSGLVPYGSHPDMPQFHNQVRECAAELRELGKQVREQRMRLSFHPSQFVILNSPDPTLTANSIRDLVIQAEVLDEMELGPEAVLVIHVGGTYGNPEEGCRRWIETYRNLPEPAQRRLVLENDDIRYSAGDVLKIHEHTGVRLVFDNLHFSCNNPQQLNMSETLRRFIATWPEGQRAKIHYSSPNTSMREVERKNRKTGKREKAILPPVWTGHADFVNPFEFMAFMQAAAYLAFDVMLEAKAKDVALMRLRRDLTLYACDVAARFGLTSAATEQDEEIEVAEIDASMTEH